MMERFLILGLFSLALVAAAPSAPAFEPFYGIREAGREAGDAIERASIALGPTAETAVHQARQALRTARQRTELPLPPLGAPAQAVLNAAAPQIEVAREIERRAATFPFDGIQRGASQIRQGAGLPLAPAVSLPVFNITVPGMGVLTFPTSFNIPAGFSLPANFAAPTNLTLPTFNGTIPGLPGRFTIIRDTMARVLPPTVSERINALRESAGQAVMPGGDPEGTRRPFLGGVRDNIMQAAEAQAPSPIAEAIRELSNRLRFPTLAQDEGVPMDEGSSSASDEMPAQSTSTITHSRP